MNWHSAVELLIEHSSHNHITPASAASLITQQTKGWGVRGLGWGVGELAMAVAKQHARAVLRRCLSIASAAAALPPPLRVSLKSHRGQRLLLASDR